jgi:hypothetical protein
MKIGIALLVGLIVGTYTAFVSMCLWNWFATRAFHVPDLSFFEMLGLVWLLQVLFGSVGQDSEPHWRMLWTLLDKLVPQNSRDAYAAAMKELEQDVWAQAAVGAISQVVDNTLMLGLGFGLHLVIT